MNMHARNLYEVYRIPSGTPTPSLLPSLEQLHYDRGEERLMLAVLKDAVECIERYRHEYGARSRATYDDALRWVRGNDRTWLFSFENVCLGLSLDPSRLRSLLDGKRPPHD
jgi:hypothetical protein